MSRMTDAHAHVENVQEIKERTEQQVFTLACAKNRDEYEQYALMMSGAYIRLTAGFHPWNCMGEPEQVKAEADRVTEIFGELPAVGEIGLDSVWCKCDMDLQREVFNRQLQEAARLGKPVILHTKGMEEEIAQTIRAYPNRYLVHWYSCGEHLEKYMEQDCYFSIGPDVIWNENVRSLVRRVDPSRLLLETDGMDAVRWAYREGMKRGILSAEHVKVPATPADALRMSAGESITLLNELMNTELGEADFLQMTYENLCNFLLKKTI